MVNFISDSFFFYEGATERDLLLKSVLLVIRLVDLLLSLLQFVSQALPSAAIVLITVESGYLSIFQQI